MTQSDAAGRLRDQLEDRGFELLGMPPEAKSGRLQVSAGVLRPFTVPPYGVLYAVVPVQLSVEVDASGNVARLDGGKPAPRDVSAAQTWLEDLVANNELEGLGGRTPTPRATHLVSLQADGRRVVRRKGFQTSA